MDPSSSFGISSCGTRQLFEFSLCTARFTFDEIIPQFSEFPLYGIMIFHQKNMLFS
jgi:hypothetical protein